LKTNEIKLDPGSYNGRRIDEIDLGNGYTYTESSDPLDDAWSRAQRDDEDDELDGDASENDTKQDLTERTPRTQGINLHLIATRMTAREDVKRTVRVEEDQSHFSLRN
jgi:hypothetical protein